MNALAQITGATYYHAQLGPPDKGRASIKGSVGGLKLFIGRKGWKLITIHCHCHIKII